MKNRSNKAIALTEQSLFSKDSEGYSSYPLSKREVIERVNASAGFASAVAGAGVLTANAVASRLAVDMTKELFQFGSLPPKSAKKGVLYFAADKREFKRLSLHFQPGLLVSQGAVVFKLNKTTRKPANPTR